MPPHKRGHFYYQKTFLRIGENMNVVGYKFPVTSETCNGMGINRMSQDYAIRRRKERELLHRVKRDDCRKQLAVYSKQDNHRILVGFVNMYHDGSAFWHDVTVNGNPGRTYRMGETWKLTKKTMRALAGECNPNVNIYAIRF